MNKQFSRDSPKASKRGVANSPHKRLGRRKVVTRTHRIFFLRREAVNSRNVISGGNFPVYIITKICRNLTSSQSDRARTSSSKLSFKLASRDSPVAVALDLRALPSLSNMSITPENLYLSSRV
ncbi:unnamed protein product, partial [Nesidiocoris tenuis]